MLEPNSEQLQTVIQSQEMIEEIASLNILINDPTLGVEIEPLKIYCQKTGHIVGQRDQNSLFSLIKMKGKNAIIPSLYNATTLSVHPAWIETNGETLDQLIDSDPIGYACYCFGLITSGFYQTAKNQDRKRQPWIERYWAMARANALLVQRGIAGLDQLNIELCKLLTYAPDTQSYLFKRARKMAETPDMLAMLHCSGELTELLRDCTNRCLAAIQSTDHYIQKTRFVDYAATPADAARGPSNIRQQKASKRDVKEATMFAELAKLFGESGLKIDSVNMVDGTKRWKQIVSVSKTKEAEMLADLMEFGGTNLDNVFDAAETEDNEIEVNSLPMKTDETPDEPQTSTHTTTSAQITIQQLPAELQQAKQIISTMPIRPVMAQIAKAVMENIVAKPETWHDAEGNLITEPGVVNTPVKPMSALERLRAKKLGGK